MQRGAVFQTTDGGQAELQLRTSGDRQLRFSSRVSKYGGNEGPVARTVDGAVVHMIIGNVATFSFTFVSIQLYHYLYRRHTDLCND